MQESGDVWVRKGEGGSHTGWLVDRKTEKEKGNILYTNVNMICLNPSTHKGQYMMI